MDWWGIALILAIGIAVVVYGYLDDRRRTRERDATLAAPPDRPIPKFEPDDGTPEYLSDLQARKRPARLPAGDLDEAVRAELRDLVTSSAEVPAGLASKRFVTDPSTGWAVAREPLVLICADRVETVRELLPIIERAQRLGRPLVLAAPGMSNVVLDTLAANTTQGHQLCIPVVATSDQLTELAGLTLAQPLDHTDLQAGWAPEESLGSIGTWVSDRSHTWLIA